MWKKWIFSVCCLTFRKWIAILLFSQIQFSFHVTYHEWGDKTNSISYEQIDFHMHKIQQNSKKNQWLVNDVLLVWYLQNKTDIKSNKLIVLHGVWKSQKRYWCKCKLYQVWVDLEDLSFQTFFSITLRFHDCLASNFDEFFIEPKWSKIGFKWKVLMQM